MVSVAIKQIGRSTLAHLPWVWEGARGYVRYSPRILLADGINERVNAFYVNRPREFVTRTAFGSLISGSTSDIIQRYIYLYGQWEPNLTWWLLRRLRRGDVFVDVGANIGYFSLLASRAVGEGGKVVAIEASPSIFAQLRSNVDMNHAANVRLLNRAASATNGAVRLFRAPAHNLGATSTFEDVGFEEEATVEAQPLHRMLTAHEISRARVIKIDVEGAEVDVVKGLLPTLESARQDLEVVVEVGGGPHSSPPASESAAAIVPMFLARGFNVYRITNDYSPASYANKNASARPARVVDIASIAEECDLIFSRREAAAL